MLLDLIPGPYLTLIGRECQYEAFPNTPVGVPGKPVGVMFGPLTAHLLHHVVLSCNHIRKATAVLHVSPDRKISLSSGGHDVFSQISRSLRVKTRLQSTIYKVQRLCLPTWDSLKTP
ncbi:Hypothetical predicted protein [Pelobates cultripes]|uniref:Uncharacterized protein n=1 Tax=Pelobates cultripes TaxID=61616 RepID=A0AAD1TN12_PELCU|nr:Hypothetical predicted protein [Pelobates cultripes]